MRLISIATLLLLASSVFAENNNAELEAYNDRYNEIAENYDVEAFAALYTDSAVWIDPQNPPVPVSQAGVGMFQFLASNEGKLTHSLDQSYVSDDGTLAVMIGTAAVDAPKIGVNGTATYLFVMERDGKAAEWKIAADMFNQHAPKESAE